MMKIDSNNIHKNNARCVAILGTGSDVGKSIVVTALCRILKKRGLMVAPFKAQNMSNNSFVTLDGGEMGRAQVVQAEACGLEPHVDMNPVLLKPSTDTGSQVILHGSAIGDHTSSEYWGDTDYLFRCACESLSRLREMYDWIILEGAGSCAEINLMDRDFVNFRIATEAEASVILVADIDRGGVFAQIIGTLEILPPNERKLIKGFIINRFRGDATLFDNGITYLEQKTGLPVLGLIPYYYHIDIDSEDGVILDSPVRSNRTFEKDILNIGILKLPHISNFTDFNVFQRDSSIHLQYLYYPSSLDSFDLVILPGTKNVRFDIEWLRERGWEPYLRSYVQNKGQLGGICGGYQMLGTRICDPDGIEGDSGETTGFGFLDVETVLRKHKTLTRITGISLLNGQQIQGYEIHMGETIKNEKLQSFVRINERNGQSVSITDGAMNIDKNVWGCYIHGLFDDSVFRTSFLRTLKPGWKLNSRNLNESTAEFKNRQYDLLALHFEKYLNMEKLSKILGITLV